MLRQFVVYLFPVFFNQSLSEFNNDEYSLIIPLKKVDYEKVCTKVIIIVASSQLSKNRKIWNQRESQFLSEII